MIMLSGWVCKKDMIEVYWNEPCASESKDIVKINAALHEKHIKSKTKPKEK